MKLPCPPTHLLCPAHLGEVTARLHRSGESRVRSSFLRVQQLHKVFGMLLAFPIYLSNHLLKLIWICGYLLYIWVTIQILIFSLFYCSLLNFIV